MTKFPDSVTLDNDQAIKLIIALRGSEITKTNCGRRLLLWLKNTEH